MILYRIYVPETITTELWDEYGEQYHVAPADAVIVDRPYGPAEAMDALRAVRNGRLVACDYTQLPDVNLTPAQVEAWRIYRQELRDITDGLEWNVTTWPIAPW
jgi:hypothetical protein